MMGSLSGILQRPVMAASALAVASVSTDYYDKVNPFKSSEDTCPSSLELEQSNPSPNLSLYSLNETNSSWVSRVSVSILAQLSFVNGVRAPVPNIHLPIPNSNSKANYSLIASSPFLLNLYQSANLTKFVKPVKCSYTVPPLSSDVLYRWHLPNPNTIDVSGVSECSSAKSRTVVVLLGWLGARQKHLSKYAEWYTSRGFHVITFTFPMSEVLSYKAGGKAEEDVELLVNHLAEWLEEEDGKNMVFHTFSNTGWLTYGTILENFQKKDSALTGRIKGCIVDSAPVATPDPQVFASGFSAAFLKKNSVATKGYVSEPDADGTRTSIEVRPALTEAALLLILQKFFGVVLNHPSINRRLSDVLTVLTSEQPSCPQLYIYSSADKVIPAGSVESFIEDQRKTGREVRACNFVSTPHVDHFRNDPTLYSSQLTQFLDDCVLTCCKHSS